MSDCGCLLRPCYHDLRAELAETRRKYLDAHAEGYRSARSDRESGAFRPSFEQFEAMEAAIARVRELCASTPDRIGYHCTMSGSVTTEQVLSALDGAE